MRVVIVDDQELMRRGLSMLLETSDVHVVGEAADGAEALRVVADCSPDVVLTDARMTGVDGVELVRLLHETHPDLPVIILTTFDDDELVRDAIAGGAAGFLLKDTSTDDLLHALQAAVAGGLVIDPRVARVALRRTRDTPASPLDLLSPAERHVAEHVADGATNAEIAAALCITEGTAKNHVSALLRKLDQRDRTRLALFLDRSRRELARQAS